MLIKAGYPLLTKAAYVASVLPQRAPEISKLVPWGWGQIDQSLETLLGAVPGAKILHGSDEASEPEVLGVCQAGPRLARAPARHLSRPRLTHA